MSVFDNLQFGLAKRAIFSGRARARFYDKFSRFTSKGISISGALDMMYGRYAQRRDSRAQVFARIRNHYNQGMPISQALAPYIPHGERQLIQAGEESGEIDNGFHEAKRMAEVTLKIRGTLIAELAYPILLLITVGIILGVIAFQLVPALEDAVPFEKWPSYSRGLYYISHGVVDYGIIGVILLVIAFVLSLRSLPRWRGHVRERVDRFLPPWTIYRELVGSSLLISLAALINAGVPLMQSVDRLSMAATPWLKVHLARTSRGLMAGGDPGPALRTGLFPRDVEDDIEDFTKTIGFETALKSIGEDQVTDAVARIQVRSAVVRIVLFVVVLLLLLYIYSASGMVATSVTQKAMSGY